MQSEKQAAATVCVALSSINHTLSVEHLEYSNYIIALKIQELIWKVTYIIQRQGYTIDLDNECILQIAPNLGICCKLYSVK